jgi:hypothetical protein
MEFISRKEALELLECKSYVLEGLINLGLPVYDPINNTDQFSFKKEEVLELKGLNHGALFGFHGKEAFLQEVKKWGDNMTKK